MMIGQEALGLSIARAGLFGRKSIGADLFLLKLNEA